MKEKNTKKDADFTTPKEKVPCCSLGVLTDITEKTISIVASKDAEIKPVEHYVATKVVQIERLGNGEVPCQESFRPNGLSDSEKLQ